MLFRLVVGGNDERVDNDVILDSVEPESLRSHAAVRSLLRRFRPTGCVPMSAVERVAARLDGGDEVEAALVELIERSGLPEPHRTVIRRRYGFEGEPVGNYRLGRELHMADRTVRKLETDALEMLGLRRELAAAGQAAA